MYLTCSEPCLFPFLHSQTSHSDFIIYQAFAIHSLHQFMLHRLILQQRLSCPYPHTIGLISQQLYVVFALGHCVNGLGV